VTLFLGPHHWADLRDRLERSYPEEGCGLLLGRFRDGDRVVREIWPAANVWGEPEGEAVAAATSPGSKRNRFAIAPRVLFDAQKSARDRGLDIVGVYHSHPNSPAEPSAFDRAIAWETYAYLIVRIAAGRATDTRCWVLDATGQFQAEAIAELD